MKRILHIIKFRYKAWRMKRALRHLTKACFEFGIGTPRTSDAIAAFLSAWIK